MSDLFCHTAVLYATRGKGEEKSKVHQCLTLYYLIFFILLKPDSIFQGLS